MAMQPTTWSLSALAVELGIDRRTLAKALADVPPAELQRGAPRWRLRDALAALERQAARRAERRAEAQPEPVSSAEFLESLVLPAEAMIPWKQTLPLDEYESALGLDHDEGELVAWLAYGFPVWPPAPGEKLARVSLPHAYVWRCLFGSVIQALGGDGQTLHLAEEARRIRERARAGAG